MIGMLKSHKAALEQTRGPRRAGLRALFGWVWPRLHPYRWVALGTLVAMALQGLLEAYPVQLLRKAIHEITSPHPAMGSRLIFLVGVWYLCAVAAAIASVFAAYWAACLGTGLGARTSWSHLLPGSVMPSSVSASPSTSSFA